MTQIYSIHYDKHSGVRRDGDYEDEVEVEKNQEYGGR